MSLETKKLRHSCSDLWSILQTSLKLKHIMQKGCTMLCTQKPLSNTQTHSITPKHTFVFFFTLTPFTSPTSTCTPNVSSFLLLLPLANSGIFVFFVCSGGVSPCSKFELVSEESQLQQSCCPVATFSGRHSTKCCQGSQVSFTVVWGGIINVHPLASLSHH